MGGDKIFGCSLKCLDIISKKYNYSLVYAGQFNRDQHHDAFFVRNDLIKPEEKKYIPLLSDFNNVIVDIHNRNTNNKYKICLDYEYYLKGNNLEQSQNKIKHISKKFLANKLIIDKIVIGQSNTNTKIIKLDKIYPPDTKLIFKHNYKDTFTYKFNNNELSITRIDEPFGWGQDLHCYL